MTNNTSGARALHPGTAKTTTTRLYQLAPRGLGSLETESLTSYVRRLSAAHVVAPSALVRKEILEPYCASAGLRHAPIQPTLVFESINAAFATTRLLVDSLGFLTGVANLAALTLLGRDQAICFDGSFRHERAWCPRCLAEDEPWDRLLWALRATTACARHDQLLIDACAHCGKSHRPWHRRANPTTCPHCGAALGSTAKAAHIEIEADERALRDVMATLLTGGAITKSQIAHGVIALLASHPWATVTATTGASSGSLCGLRRQSLRGELKLVLALIAGSGEAAVDFLGHAPAAILTRRLTQTTPGRPRGRPLVHSRTALEAALRSALAQPQGQIPSVRSFARAHHTSRDTLGRYWPELTKALGHAYKEQERARRRAREATEVVLLEAAFAESRRIGAPNRRTVEELMVRGELFLQPHIRGAYKRLLGNELKGTPNAA
jgi:hypothetical protein